MRSPPQKHTFAIIVIAAIGLSWASVLADGSSVVTGIDMPQGKRTLVIKTSGEPGKVVAGVLDKPHRLVLDIEGAKLGKVRPNLTLGEAGIQALRAANFKGSARVVADFQNQPVPQYSVKSDKSTVVVEFGHSPAVMARSQKGRAVAAAQKDTVAPVPKLDPRDPPKEAPNTSLREWLSEGVESAPTPDTQGSTPKPSPGKARQAKASTDKFIEDQGWAEPAEANAARTPEAPPSAESGQVASLSAQAAPPMGSSQDLGVYRNMAPFPRRQVEPAGKPDSQRTGAPQAPIPDTRRPSAHVPVQQARPPVVPPEPDPRLVMQEITEIKFLQVGHNSRLWVQATDHLDYRVVKVSATKLRLDLINAEIPKKYQKPLRTDKWSTSVDTIIPGSQTIFIYMKEAVPYKVEKKKGILMVDFPPPRLELSHLQAVKPGVVPQGGRGTGPAASSPSVAGQAAPSATNTTSGSSTEHVDCESSPDCLRSKIDELVVERDKRKKVLSTPDSEILSKPITMDFQDIKLKNAFRLLSEQAGINITMDPEVDGTTTLRLQEIPLLDAIDTILATNDLERVMVGDVIRVGKAKKIQEFMQENKSQITSIEQRITAFRSKIKAIEDRKKKEENPSPIEGSLRTDEIGEAGCIKIEEEEICFYYSTVRLTYAKPSQIVKILDCMFNMNCPGTAAGSSAAAQSNEAASSVADQKLQREQRISQLTEKLQEQGFSPDSPGSLSRIVQAEQLDLDRQRTDAATARTDAYRSRTGLSSLDTQRSRREREIIANSMLWQDDDRKMIFMKDTSERLAQMKQVIKSLDLPTPQVMIESRLVRASREWSRELGVRWGGRNNQNGQIDNNKKTFWGITGHQGDTKDSNANTPTGTTLVPGPPLGDIPSRFAINLPSPLANSIAGNLMGLGMQFGLLGTQYVTELDVRLEIGEGARQAKVIARPKVQVVDGQPAKILDGKDIPIQTTSPQLGTQTQLVPAYLQLEVTPRIYADARINMKVQVKDDDLGPVSDAGPIIVRRQAHTIMVVKDGETAVIGGIVKERNQNTRQGWPGLMNVPLVGYLFSNKGQEKEMNELLVFITPTIIKRPPPAS
jgi:type IV pilus assembly protein PilQ